MLPWKPYRMANFRFSFPLESSCTCFKNNPVMLAGRQFFCERFSRACKAERTTNKKHLLFIEFSKNTLYLYKLKGISTYVMSLYPISPGFIRRRCYYSHFKDLENWSPENLSDWKVVKSSLKPVS